jgi:hypothetical protein
MHISSDCQHIKIDYAQMCRLSFVHGPNSKPKLGFIFRLLANQTSMFICSHYNPYLAIRISVIGINRTLINNNNNNNNLFI